MKKRGTWEDRGNQEGNYKNQEPPNKGRQGRVSFDKRATSYANNMGQSEYDYEEKNSDIGGEKKLVLEILQHPVSTQL